jgi:UDP-N-acetylmuramoyl-L-alanyl-D-glutamate--2,6-diaminopimelate ligase
MPRTLAKLLGIDAPLPAGQPDMVVSGLTSDSREVMPGFVFAGLPGSAVDGASFIAQAFQKGAVAAICQSGAYKGPGLVIESGNVRRLFALMASRWHGSQPDTIVAVTGTNGKTSVAAFVRQIWAAMGFRAASLGTIGVIGPSGSAYLQHTTPDPMKLHALAADLKADHVDHLAIEASSHGLSQHRLDGLRLTAGAFTNLTRDHLDYHATLEDYFAAKMRLFDELLPAGAPAVINMDSPHGADVLRHATAHGLTPYTVGRAGTSLTLLDEERDGMGQTLHIRCGGKEHSVSLPLVGAFQTSNALVAAGLLIASGGEEALVFHALESLKGAPGRLELVGRTAAGAGCFVDYAHTPDALENAITALKPYVAGKLSVVFGCGGDRDRGKRPQMGAIATRLADRVFVTDDNPRTEDAAAIRREIMAASPGATEVGDRAQAIRSAVDGLGAGDILLVAGKGHEEGQIIGKTVVPFSDHEAVRAALAGVDYHG